MSTMRLSTATDAELESALDQATTAVRAGALVVLPTDTVYGLGADAFSAEAVQKLLDAKGRGRNMPPPVLISSPSTLDALATDVPEFARTLVAHFWPGALTLVCHQQPSLQWDLGETKGTVAVRLPKHDVSLALLERTGPLAVSSANLSGQPAALDVDAAQEMLGDSVEIYLDGGAVDGGEASTIVDVTGPTARVLRMGAISEEALREALQVHPDVVLEGEGIEPPPPGAGAAEAAAQAEADAQANGQPSATAPEQESAADEGTEKA